MILPFAAGPDWSAAFGVISTRASLSTVSAINPLANAPWVSKLAAWKIRNSENMCRS
jgi:hypothetical protein